MKQINFLKNKTTSNVNANDDTVKDKEEDDFDGDNDGEEEPDSTLFVKNLNFDTNEASLKKASDLNLFHL